MLDWRVHMDKSFELNRSYNKTPNEVKTSKQL